MNRQELLEWMWVGAMALCTGFSFACLADNEPLAAIVFASAGACVGAVVLGMIIKRVFSA